MIRATTEILKEIEEKSEQLKQKILQAKDKVVIRGTTYYVSNDGDDANDGKTPVTPWKSLAKVSDAVLCEGDGVRFRRGDLFRGTVMTKPGVTYAAYGEGEKPKFYGWHFSLADPKRWTLYDAEHNIWKMTEKILDCGTIFFNHGTLHCRKLIPSYMGGRFVCRDHEDRVFDMAQEMTQDLDLYWHYEDRMNTQPSKGLDFPVPLMDAESYGDLYLRCDRGNPGEVFHTAEPTTRGAIFFVKQNPNITIDNLCMQYCNFAISAGGHSVGLHVSNCELGYIGGAIQSYLGLDPNFPQGPRGSVTRYGNAIEIYGGCDDYVVTNNYVYQVYDAGISHQITTRGKHYEMKNIRYENNLVEYCVYAIEYFLEKTNGDTDSFIENCEMCGNILRFSGYGWGQQRHNTYTPAHIKGWSYENTARNYRIHDNIFDRAGYRMIHTVAKKAESCPEMYNNTYLQDLGMSLGSYGANEIEEPENMRFDENADKKIATVLKDKNAKVYYID